MTRLALEKYLKPHRFGLRMVLMTVLGIIIAGVLVVKHVIPAFMMCVVVIPVIMPIMTQKQEFDKYLSSLMVGGQLNDILADLGQAQQLFHGELLLGRQYLAGRRSGRVIPLTALTEALLAEKSSLPGGKKLEVRANATDAPQEKNQVIREPGQKKMTDAEQEATQAVMSQLFGQTFNTVCLCRPTSREHAEEDLQLLKQAITAARG